MKQQNETGIQTTKDFVIGFLWEFKVTLIFAIGILIYLFLQN